MNINLEDHNTILQACQYLAQVPSIRASNSILFEELLKEMQSRIDLLQKLQGE